MNGLLAHDVEQRLHLREGLGGAADHEGQRAGLGADDAARGAVGNFLLIDASSGNTLAAPAFAQDGGEEPEIAGLYVIGPDGVPFRLGFALGNEFSDHVMERVNYLYLAHSKLRPAALGPELLVGDLPADIRGVNELLVTGPSAPPPSGSHSQPCQASQSARCSLNCAACPPLYGARPVAERPSTRRQCAAERLAGSQ